MIEAVNSASTCSYLRFLEVGLEAIYKSSHNMEFFLTIIIGIACGFIAKWISNAWWRWCSWKSYPNHWHNFHFMINETLTPSGEIELIDFMKWIMRILMQIIQYWCHNQLHLIWLLYMYLNTSNYYKFFELMSQIYI